MVPDTRIHAQGNNLVRFRLCGVTVRHDIRSTIVPRCRRGGGQGGVSPSCETPVSKRSFVYRSSLAPVCLTANGGVFFRPWRNHPVGCPATHRKIKRVVRWVGICLWPSTRPSRFSAPAGARSGWRVWPGSSCTTGPKQQPGHTGQLLATRPDGGNHRLVDDKHPPPAAHSMTAIVSMPARMGVHVRLESVFIFAGIRRWQLCVPGGSLRVKRVADFSEIRTVKIRTPGLYSPYSGHTNP